MEDKKLTPESVWCRYKKALDFNNSIRLDETVEANENFFIGKQWEGVQANGLPTPVFNFLKRTALFQVASITSDNIKLNAAPMGIVPGHEDQQIMADIVNKEFAALFEQNRIPILMREMLRNAAVDGDGCTYTYWDPDVDTGQEVKGVIVTEILENTRVFFGNPNDRRVQKQPWIIISKRDMLDDVRWRVKENGGDPETVRPDEDEKNTAAGDPFHTDDKVTVLLLLRRDRESGHIMGYECSKDLVLREEWDLGIRLYPVTWLNWDFVQNCYHGQAMITGLIPNQVFINKAWAMSMISLMSSAYPKIVYDKTRVSKWDNRVGGAIGINGGDVNTVAKIVEPAQISPQIAQFIQLAIDESQTMLGATSAALGDTRPDNTSAIIALQRASSVPSEITKQTYYNAVEDLGRIYVDFMAANYGRRLVEREAPKDTPPELMAFAGLEAGDPMYMEFDFAKLADAHMTLKLDVGASSYWSEIAAMQTLDNLLQQGQIGFIDYLERMPDGYLQKKQELIEKLKAMQNAQPQLEGGQAQAGGGGAAPEEGVEIPTGGGYSALQRKINETGEIPKG